MSLRVDERSARGRGGLHVTLWGVQVLLALLYLWAGGLKLVMPLADLEAQGPLPGWFLRLIGVVEALGALGLVLPGLTGLAPGLTPLAAAGLVIVMAGAVVVTLATGGGLVLALVPLAAGLLAALVAWGRWRLAPLRGRVRRRAG